MLLFVSDGLFGIADALKRQFPYADHQSCWVHLSRTVTRFIREKDRYKILNDLKSVYTQDNLTCAKEKLKSFLKQHTIKYPKLKGIFQNQESLFSYYSYPQKIRQSIYTSNLIENWNKGLKHRTKSKEQFPDESALERFVCSYCIAYNNRYAERSHCGFNDSQCELEQLFSERYVQPVSTANN